MNVLGDPMAAIGSIPEDWLEAVGPAALPERLAPIAEFVARKRQSTRVLPNADRVFAALAATPFDSVRAVILGQDPYPNATHATGLAFSVPKDLRPLPQSLRNIRTELRSDLGMVPPDHGSLEAWTRHGVLLLNTALTFHEGIPGSHDPAGWANLTDAVISTVAAKERPVAFLLWGVPAKAKGWLIDERRLGQMATLMGDWPRTEVDFARAMRRNLETGARGEVAETRFDWANALLRHGLARDRERASAMLEAAARGAAEVGMEPLRARATDALAALKAGPGPLSTRELEVTALLAEGLTNKEVAARLRLSVRTAENHVLNVMNKLGMDNRAQVAAWYTRTRSTGESLKLIGVAAVAPGR